MASRSCRLSITDILGIARTIEVQASSLFEAVAEGLLAIRGGDLAFPDGFTVVKVSVPETRKEYEVRLKDFGKRLDRRGDSPREVTHRKEDQVYFEPPAARVRYILRSFPHTQNNVLPICAHRTQPRLTRSAIICTVEYTPR
jgi:hypothetical protein